jgi:phage gp16-like protein
MSPSKAQLAKIHIAKKELQLTDEVYRDILALNFKVESAKDLTDRQAVQLLEIFRGKGWQVKSKKAAPGQKKRSGNFIAIKPGPVAAQQRKVLAMWNELGYSMEKLHSRCRTQFYVDRFEWLTDSNALHVLITDLNKRIKTMKGKKQ